MPGDPSQDLRAVTILLTLPANEELLKDRADAIDPLDQIRSDANVIPRFLSSQNQDVIENHRWVNIRRIAHHHTSRTDELLLGWR